MPGSFSTRANLSNISVSSPVLHSPPPPLKIDYVSTESEISRRVPPKFKSMTVPNPSALKPKNPIQTALSQPSVSMARALSSSLLKHLPSPSNFGLFSAFPPNYNLTHFRFRVKSLRGVGCLSVSDSQLKNDWLGSLSCPFVGKDGELDTDGVVAPASDATPTWVVGIDPDVSGALAVLRCDGNSVVSSQVFDTPYVQVLVGKRVRKRLDAKSIVELLRSFEAPMRTAAYIEQSIPFPKDGKQGWWSGGFGYGLWIGILVASGFSVIPVPSLLWKNHFGLSGSASSKDDSRTAASTLFPSLSSLLKRKKDHGRAEALLIAAYGKGLTVQSQTNST